MKEVELLNSIQKIQFYAVELNLYLDNFPNDKEATSDYKEISRKLDALISEYELKYGPIRSFGDAYVENPLEWVNQPWPWEIKY